MKKNMMILAAATVMTAAAVTNAAIVVLSNADSAAAVSGNGALSLPAGGASQKLYIYAQATGVGYVSNLSFSLQSSGTALTYSNFAFESNVFTSADAIRLLPGAAGAPANPTANGVSATSITSFRLGSGTATSGVTNTGLVKVASFDVAVPTGATGSTNLFLVLAQGITESNSSGVRHAVGFASTGSSTVAGITGLDGNIVNLAGTPTNNTLGFAYTTTSPSRTTTADAVVTVAAPSGPSISTATAADGVQISGTGKDFVAAVDSSAPFAFKFQNPNTGDTLVALDFGPGVTTPSFSGLTGGSVVAGTPQSFGFGSEFDAVIKLTNSITTTTPFSVSFSGLSAQPISVAVIPEPSALSLLGLAALPMLRRRRA